MTLFVWIKPQTGHAQAQDQTESRIASLHKYVLMLVVAGKTRQGPLCVETFISSTWNTQVKRAFRNSS